MRNNISVNGLPRTSNEDVTELIIELCEVYGILITVNDIEDAYREDAHTRFNTLIVKFKSFDTKKELLAAKSKKWVSVGDMQSLACDSNDASNNKSIFINNHLTPIVARMQHCGRMAIKGKKLSSCWVTSNGFMVKRNNESKPILLKTLTELERLVYDGIQPDEHNRKMDDFILPLENKPKTKLRKKSSGNKGKNKKEIKEQCENWKSYVLQ